MNRVYIRLYYLRLIHTLFFMMAIFSLGSAIMFAGLFFFDTVIFFISFVVYTDVSAWFAYVSYRHYKKEAGGVEFLKQYAIPYLTLGPLAAVLTFLIFLTVTDVGVIIYYFSFVNYYYLFVFIISFVEYRFDYIRRLFDVYSNYNIKRARKLSLRYSTLPDLKSYSIGTNPVVDQLLDDVWAHKGYPTIQIRNLELELCRQHLSFLKREIEKGKTGIITQPMEKMEKEAGDYSKKIQILKEYRG